MKVVAISRDGIYYKIGDDYDSAIWYERGENSPQLQRGDDVDVEYTVREINGRKVRVLTKVTKNESSPSIQNNSSDDRIVGDRTASIERQALLKAACQAIKTMPGQFATVDELGNDVIKLFRRLKEEFYSGS